MAQRFASKDGSNIILSVFPASGGLASGVIGAFSPPEAKPISINMMHPSSGACRTRPGLLNQMQNAPLGGIGGIRTILDFFRTVDGVKAQQTVIAANKSFWIDSGSGTYSPLQGYSSGNDIDIITSTSLVGLAIFGIKGVGLKQYNQTTMSDLTSGGPQDGYIVRKHRSSIYVAGVPDFPETLWKSDTENPTDFTTGTSDIFNIDLGVSDAKGILALAPEFLGRLYIGKLNSIYEMDTAVTAAPIRPITETIGIVSHNGVVAVGGDLLFPSLRGLHSMRATQIYGDIQDYYLTRPINNIWLNKINFDRAEEITACFSQEYNSYFMVYPDKNTNNYNLLGYNINDGSFYHWDDFGCTYVAPQIDFTTKAMKTLFGMRSGKIFTMEPVNDVLGLSSTFLDLGTPYTSSFTTPPMFPAGSPGPQFRFSKVDVFFTPKSAADITVVYKVDDKLPVTRTISQSGLTINGEMCKKTIDLTGEGQAITLTFSCTSSVSNAGAGMEILGYNIYCLPAGDIYQTVQVSN